MSPILIVTSIYLILCHVSLSQTIVTTLPGYPGDLPFTLETGYIGVGELDNVQFFYYFVESERDPETDPLMFWQTGGPACSSLTAFFFENGPLQFDYANSTVTLPQLIRNPYSWAQVANMIFLDAPVGAGFSYAKIPEAYNTSNSLTSAQMYEFLRKWLLIHPKFQSNSLYIAGDSYSGLFVPVMVQHIYDGNNAGLIPHMNLKGYVLGNPVTDLHNDTNWKIPYAHRMGLISDELYESVRKSCNGEYIDVDSANAACVKDLKAVTLCTSAVDAAMILEPVCYMLSPKPYLRKWNRTFEEDKMIDLLQYPTQPPPKLWCRSYTYLPLYIWANDKHVQKALNVREGTKTEWVRCNSSVSLTEDIVNTIDYHRNLSHAIYQALVYSGDHDMVISYMATQAWIRTLNFTIYSDWRPWVVDGQSGGFTKVYKENKLVFTYATVKGGGHTAPEYRPKECFAMIVRWLANYPL